MTTTTVSCAASGPPGPLSPSPCCQPSSGVTSAGGDVPGTPGQNRGKHEPRRSVGKPRQTSSRAISWLAPTANASTNCSLVASSAIELGGSERTPPSTHSWSRRRSRSTSGSGKCGAAITGWSGVRCFTRPAANGRVQLVRPVEHASRTRAPVPVRRPLSARSRARAPRARASRVARATATMSDLQRSASAVTSSRSWSTKLVYTSLVGDVSANPIVVSVADRSWSVRVSTSASRDRHAGRDGEVAPRAQRRFVEGQPETLGREVQLRGRLVTAVLADRLVDRPGSRPG